MFVLQGIDHVALTVRDVRRSVDWYQDVLGLERRYKDAWGDHPAVVGVGTTSVALFPADTDAPEPRLRRDVPGMRHLAFRVDGQNLATAQQELRRRGIAFEFQDHRIAQSIYFQDLDGHEIEITTYDVQDPT